jgi:DNA-3-methyladenine glycosylase I
MVNRCAWANSSDLMRKYHDEEWGIPVHDDKKLFEFLILEGAQAGLSWSIVLNKREAYKKAFSGFDYNAVSDYNDKKVNWLMENSGIIRNRLKINSAVNNAKCFIEIRREFGSFDDFIWKYVDGVQIKNNIKSMEEVPAKTELSDRISNDLKKRGFSFVGSTIIYAFMQAVGLVDDHVEGCVCGEK